MIEDIEDEVLRCGLEAEIVELTKNLGAVIGAMIGHVEQHLPADQLSVLAAEMRKWRVEELFIPQGGQISAHHLLHAVPVRADTLAVGEGGGIKRLR